MTRATDAEVAAYFAARQMGDVDLSVGLTYTNGWPGCGRGGYSIRCELCGREWGPLHGKCLRLRERRQQISMSPRAGVITGF